MTVVGFVVHYWLLAVPVIFYLFLTLNKVSIFHVMWSATDIRETQCVFPPELIKQVDVKEAKKGRWSLESPERGILERAELV